MSIKPRAIFDKLTLLGLATTQMHIELVDSLVWHSTRIAKESLVEIRGCFIPMDFVVLDMEVDESTSLILGRPFLSTTFAQIYVRVEVLHLDFNGKEEEFEFQRYFVGGVKNWLAPQDITDFKEKTKKEWNS